MWARACVGAVMMDMKVWIANRVSHFCFTVVIIKGKENVERNNVAVAAASAAAVAAAASAAAVVAVAAAAAADDGDGDGDNDDDDDDDDEFTVLEQITLPTNCDDLFH